MLGQDVSWHVRRDVETSKQILLEMKDELSRRQGEAAGRLAKRQVALQVASIRERLDWFLPFFVSSSFFLYAGFRHTKTFVVLYPLIPMTFALGYQLDFAYGNKTQRLKGMAEHILTKEKHMVSVPAWHYTNRTQAHRTPDILTTMTTTLGKTTPQQ